MSTFFTHSEQDKLPLESNNTQIEYPQEKCIHQLFETQVELTPNAVAVVFEKSCLTYQELNQRANQLAHYLNNLGVGPEVLVGIYIERSLEMIIGLLGILKAGAAYVPLDPSYPMERLAFMLEDTQTPVLLTQKKLAHQFHDQKARIICLDIDWEIISKESKDNLSSRVKPDNLAYVIYTSGSTGKPKGVAIEHHSPVILFMWAKNVFTSQELAGVLASTSICFDLSVFELFVPLSWGGKIILVENALHLPKLSTQYEVTLVNTVPSAIAELTQIHGIPDSVRVVNLAGEPLQKTLVEQIYQQETIQKVFNLYGPSEDTTYSTFALIEKGSDESPSIGQPIANTQLYVLDEQLQPVIMSVAGELYIGGDGLARGYLKRPKLTAEKFISNPFTDDPNARLYKTGDLVRYLPDGNLEFIGRIDNQVKIRGFRIELGEIEAVLSQYASIQQATVLVRENEVGEKHLVAYIVSKDSPQRLPIQCACLVKFGNEPLIELKTADISRGGLCLVDVPSSWEKGDTLRLCLQLPEIDNEKWIEGHVAWCQGQRAGIQFILRPGEKLFCENTEQLFQKIELGHIEPILNNSSTEPKNSTVQLQSSEKLIVPKRLLKRLPIYCVCIAEYADQLPIALRTENISYDGLRLIGVPESWQVDETVCLHLQLPEVSEKIHLKGVISWHEAQRAGIRFIFCSETKTTISEYVDKLIENHKIFDYRQQSSAAQQIQRFLQKKLPPYMVPSHLLFLKSMPLTLNGKIDRKALLALEHGSLKLTEDFEVAQTPTEKIVSDIWANVLHQELVSIHDHFIELGGHSLLAARVITRLRNVFKLDFPLQSLFERPTIAKLSQYIDVLRQEMSCSVLPPFKPIAYKDKTIIPLSFSQQQLWLLAQVAPDKPVYNEPFTIRLAGPINVDALTQSFNDILRRHEALRTTFITVNSQPVQVISPFEVFNLPVLDLRNLPFNEREAKALQHATAEAKQLFDLTQYPLFRATLVQLNEQDYRLFLTFHHIIIDGVSIYDVFLPELETLYKGFCQKAPVQLPPLPIQYTDFAIWQRQCLQADELETQLAYWKQKLADISTLQLPTERPRPTHSSFQGARYCLTLPKKLIEGLKALSCREGVTLFVVMLAAFKTILYRYSGQTDIAVGTITAGRNRVELEQMMGYFLNTLVLRTDFSNHPHFSQLLQQVWEVTVGAYAHQDLPFEQLVNELRPTRRPGYNPLFQVAFTIQTLAPTLDLGWTISQLDVHTSTTKFDLYLELDEKQEEMIGRIEYNTDIFDEGTIARMVGHYQTLLEGIVADAAQPVSHLPLLTTQEKQQFVEWNNTEIDFPNELCIHQLFEHQVERTPNAVAIVFEDKQLSYHELNCRANQLGHYLISFGVKPETLVGICMERSLEMVIALLGVLKAGGTYVPLDPTYPKERLAFMLEDTQMPILLTQSSLIEQLPSHQAQLLCLDSDWETDYQLSAENVNSAVLSENLAYVIYTSGSTGKPKGVMIPHNSVVNFLNSLHQQLPLTAQNTFLAVTTISFDIAVLELYLPLMIGARVILISREAAMDALILKQNISQFGITVLQATPATWRLLSSTNWEGTPQLNILSGGEALPQNIANTLLAKGKTVWNLYGPTETTVWSTIYPVTKSKKIKEELSEALEPIGRPIANTQIYILDQNHQCVPIGVPGELYIGGVGLARGYFNRPKLTEEKFIFNLLSDKADSRLYKTGDLARYLPDGNIEFLGRLDQQVKIRGFRIELGEIEALLSQHSTVQEVVVIVREETPGDKRLVAYIVAKPQLEASNL